MIQTAHDAGCPRDQVERFLQAGYVPLVKMWKFHAAARLADDRSKGISDIMLDGTRGSAKSHAIIAQVGLDDCQRFPGLKVLFLRLTQKAAGESFDDLISRVLHGIPHEQNTEKVTFPNGSRIIIGGYKDERDIDKYVGIEYDCIVLEEATQITGDKYEKLLGSRRTSKADWVPRVYLSTNPGDIGHVYFKERFVTPQEEHRETFTRRFFASYKDNPFINPEYATYLESLTGDLAKAWTQGDWSIFAGQAFSQFKYSLHVIPPFEIPAGWAKWRAIDWGSAAPFTCGWFTRDPDNGRLYIYRQIRATDMTDAQQARAIKEATPPTENISTTYADPSMWNKTRQDKDKPLMYATADIYGENGIILTKANNDRLQGKRAVDRLLANLPDGRPAMQIFNHCLSIIKTLPALVRDKLNAEDVDTHQNDHDYDMVRYGLSNIRPPVPPPQKPKVNPIWNIKGL
jgi:phage terminase large subunit